MCSVEDNACIVSESGATGKYVQCDSCDCQRIWLSKQEVYHGGTERLADLKSVACVSV